MKRTLLVLLVVIMAFTSCYFTSEPDNLPTLGMIAYYSFDGNVKDQYIFDNHCTDSTSSGYVDGIKGLAKDFNGETDMLHLQSPLNANEGLTFSFWLKSKGVKIGQENGVVICKYNKDNGGRFFNINTQASLTTSNPSLRGNFYAYANTSSYRDCAYSDIMSMDGVTSGDDTLLYTLHNPMKLPLNEWTHCVINVTETEIQAWINGVLTVSKTREYSEYGISAYDRSDIPSYIGNCPALGYGDNNHYHGAIDEMRIYKRPLSPEEIIYIFQNTHSDISPINSTKVQSS
ncbi:MAG: LamG domain-containing protein [Candidatus Marinimicrobia bacterium]|nr:LamG domain-containing protein [Candidatus Neomarinimicrobiota bacterium]